MVNPFPHDPKCLVVQPIHAAGLAQLVAQGITPVLCPAQDMETVARHVPGCVAAITRDAGFDARAFAAADKLRVLVVHGAGHDPVDKQAAARAGVLVANTPGTNARSVAEMALGLAIAVARRIPAADASLRGGQTGFRDSARFHELSGGTALVVGWGATGSALGAMLHHGLGMKVLAHSPRPPTEDWAFHAPNLHAALAQADLVSLHAPLGPQTRDLMDGAAFAAIKPGAILINMARAGLVDEQALLAALASGRLAGAGLDVASGQAPLGPLSRFGNVIFTPHLGGTTEAALRRTAEAAAQHVITALSGKMPPTAINPLVWSAKA
jgi:D-3-phosphoglycerate dehydrogenase